MLLSDLTSLVPPQFSYWLQVRKAGTLNVVFVVVVVVVVVVIIIMLLLRTKAQVYTNLSSLFC